MRLFSRSSLGLRGFRLNGMFYFSAMLVRRFVPDGRGGMLILRLAACRRLLLAVCGLNILLLTVSRLRLLSLNS